MTGFGKFPFLKTVIFKVQVFRNSLSATTFTLLTALADTFER